MLLGRKLGRGTLLLQHNPFVQFTFPWNVIERLEDRIVGRYAIRSASVVAAGSKHTRAYVERISNRADVRLLYNGFNTRCFRPVHGPDERRLIRRRLGLPEAAFIAFTIRRLVYRNGVKVLVEAGAELSSSTNVLIVIAGSGPEETSLRQTISQKRLTNVRLVGNIDDSDVADYYRASDVFVLPTITGEGFSTAVMEALGSGLPVVASNVGSPQEIVIDDYNGYLTEPGAAHEIAERVTALRMDSARAAQMARDARESALQFDWDRQIGALELLLTEAARNMIPKISKIESTLGFRPSTPLKEGLRRLISDVKRQHTRGVEVRIGE
jgi:glycosyltransferase involved in cell wall biosynthesis